MGPGKQKRKGLCNLFCFTRSLHFLNAPVKMLCGAIAGMGAQTLTYPGDLVRRRMQANGMQGKKVYSSAWHCVRQVIRLEGYMGFYRGVHVAWARVLPGAA